MKNFPVNKQIQGGRILVQRIGTNLGKYWYIHKERNHKGPRTILMSSLDFSQSRIRKKLIYIKAKNKGAKVRGLPDTIAAT